MRHFLFLIGQTINRSILMDSAILQGRSLQCWNGWCCKAKTFGLRFVWTLQNRIYRAWRWIHPVGCFVFLSKMKSHCSGWKSMSFHHGTALFRHFWIICLFPITRPLIPPIISCCPHIDLWRMSVKAVFFKLKNCSVPVYGAEALQSRVRISNSTKSHFGHLFKWQDYRRILPEEIKFWISLFFSLFCLPCRLLLGRWTMKMWPCF